MSKTFLKNLNYKNTIFFFILAIIVIVFGAYSFTLLNTMSDFDQGMQQFSHLAYSMTRGQVNFIENGSPYNHPETLDDVVPFNGKYYWSLGIFPSIPLIPFTFIFGLFGKIFTQGSLQFFMVAGTGIFLYLIARRFKYTKLDSIFISSGFCFGSMFLFVMFNDSSWVYAHAVTVFLIFWALWENYHKRRYWLIGIIFGMLLLTRVTAGLGIIFFILQILFFKTEKNKIKKLFALLIPFILIACFIPIYNYARFGDITETGYSISVVGKIGAQHEFFVKARNYGLFSIYHLPGNLYYAFLAGPDPVFRDGVSHVLKFPYIKPNPWGMSIFLTSPYLLYLLFLKNKTKTSWFLLLTSIVIAIPIFLYYGIGYYQFGYRYALDFMPFLFLLFLINYKNKNKYLSTNLKVIIILAIIFNFYLFCFL